MSQNKYSINTAVAFAGMMADTAPCAVDSFSAEGPIPFGAPVVKGAVKSTVKKPTAGGSFRGFALHTHAHPNAVSGSSVGYRAFDTVNVMRRGRIWVAPAVAVSDNEQVYMTATGELTNVATGNTLLETCRFRTDSAQSELALVEINLT